MTEKLIKTEQFKTLFTKLIEFGECYCDIFGVDNDKITKAKHNLLELKTSILFKAVYDECIGKIVPDIAKVINTFADSKLLEWEDKAINEINKGKPTKNKR